MGEWFIPTLITIGAFAGGWVCGDLWGFRKGILLGTKQGEDRIRLQYKFLMAQQLKLKQKEISEEVLDTNKENK